jgi:hypothetical protein
MTNERERAPSEGNAGIHSLWDCPPNAQSPGLSALPQRDVSREQAQRVREEALSAVQGRAQAYRAPSPNKTAKRFPR